MSLISQSLPNLVNGVSQQPASQRLASQGESQENGMSSIVEGLSKRPPTHHSARIIDGEVDEATMHLINRDLEERYSVVITNGTIQVFDLDTGEEKTVNDETDDGYLEAEDPTTAFRAVTIADYTFLVNTEKTVLMNDIGTTFTITINTAHTGGTYAIDLRDTIDEFDFGGFSVEGLIINTVASNTNTTTLATAINSALNANAAFNTMFSSVAVNNVLTVEAWAGGLPFNLKLRTTAPALDDDWSMTFVHEREPRGLAFVRQGNYGTDYALTISGHYANTNPFSLTVSNTTSNTDITAIQTGAIATKLTSLLDANATFNSVMDADSSGPVIRVQPFPSGTLKDMSFTATDGNGNRNLVAITDRIQKFTDLPASAYDQFTVKITGDAGSEEDNYYVRFNADTHGVISSGVWEESSGLNIGNHFDLSTMPHILVREADGTFTFRRADWDYRQAGDEDSNPNPSFVGRQINDVVFFRNRLGFLADENVILSAVGPDYFRFWRKTVQTVLDGDPIDIAASNVSVSIMRHAVPFTDKRMVLFSDQKQFVLSGGDLLTPKTAAINQSTSFEADPGCRPVVAGKFIYFPVKRGEYSGMREYGTDATTAVDDAPEITAHVPAYVPANVFKIAAATNENILALISRDDPEALYVYKFYFVGADKLQASWSRWPMGGTVLDANFINNVLYLLIQREDGVYQESMGVEAGRKDAGLDFEVLLDRRVTEAVCNATYNSTTNTTTWTLPYEVAEDVEVEAVIRDGSDVLQKIPVEKAAGNTTDTLTASGDWSNTNCFIGTVYEFRYGLSEIVMRTAGASGSEKAMKGGRLQVRNVSLNYEDTAYFRVEVTPDYKDTSTYPFTGKKIPSAIIGQVDLKDGEFRFPVHAKSDTVAIEIVNDSPYPCHFMGATWEGEFILKSRRQ